MYKTASIDRKTTIKHNHSKRTISNGLTGFLGTGPGTGSRSPHKDKGFSDSLLLFTKTNTYFQKEKAHGNTVL